RIAIVLAVGRLHEEAVVLAAGDDAGGRHRHAVVWRKRAVALDRGDRERGDVVVDDAADALRVGEFGADGVGQLDGEALVRLVDGVANHFHADRHRGRAFGDGRGAAGGVVVVVRRGRGAVGGRVVHAHAAGAGRLVEADGEEERAGAGIALGGAGVADAGERRSATAAGGGRGGAVARRGRGAGEVGGVVVAVHAAVVGAEGGTGIVEYRRGARAFEEVGAAEPDQVEDQRELFGRARGAAAVAAQRGLRVDQGDLAGAAGHVDRAAGIGRGQGDDVGAAGQPHQEIAAGFEDDRRQN